MANTVLRKRAGFGSLAALLLALTAFPALAGENILPEDSFWNKETAYVPAAPVTSEAKALESDEDFAFTSTWDLTLLFALDFHGNPAKGLLLLFK